MFALGGERRVDNIFDVATDVNDLFDNTYLHGKMFEYMLLSEN